MYLQAWGSFFVTFYDSQGYDGNILIRLHLRRPEDRWCESGIAPKKCKNIF
jgi:hypothetical protein